MNFVYKRYNMKTVFMALRQRHSAIVIFVQYADGSTLGKMLKNTFSFLEKMELLSVKGPLNTIWSNKLYVVLTRGIIILINFDMTTSDEKKVFFLKRMLKIALIKLNFFMKGVNETP